MPELQGFIDFFCLLFEVKCKTNPHNHINHDKDYKPDDYASNCVREPAAKKSGNKHNN